MPASDLAPFSSDLFIPRYRPTKSGDWELRIADAVLCPGYWSETVLVRDMAALVRRGSTWMSMTPMELESQEIGIRLAHGHVLIFGMGMGWSVVVCALMEAVSAVTVVEFDADVLAMHRELDIFSQLPQTARDKIRLLHDDAYTYRPDRPVDLLMPDIWLPLINDGRVDEVRRMRDNVGAAQVYFWGQEMEIARHAVAAGRALDDAGIAATIADFGLPLIGPEMTSYTERLNAAARRWMRDRWLPGTSAPWES